MHSTSEHLTGRSFSSQLEQKRNQQPALILAELVNAISLCTTEAQLIDRSLDALKKGLSAEGVYLAVSNPFDFTYSVSGKARQNSRMHKALKGSLQGLLVSGIDSISTEVIRSFQVPTSSKIVVLRSPADSQQRLLLIACCKNESLAEKTLAMVEPVIRSGIHNFRLQEAQQQADLFLERLHEASARMVRNLLAQKQLYSTLLEDARHVLNATACAVLLPTDETNTTYSVKVQVGFTEEEKPIPDALFSKALVDYELNERTAFEFQAAENTIYLLVPLTQRNSINGIFLIRCPRSSIGRCGGHWTRVAEIFGDWISMASETARLFERFAASQTEWDNTFDSIADPIYIIDDVYRLKKINKSLAAYAMKSIKVPLDPQCYRYLFNQNSICPWCPVPKSLESGMPETVEAQLFSSGTWQLQTFPFTDKHETRQGSINILRDITLLKRMQEQLIETEKLASAGKLISGVAHEVRNPLFGISATVRALANELKNKHDIQSYLDIIMSETTRMNRLMEDLLSYSRPVKIDKNPSDLMELVKEVVDQFTNLEGQSAQIHVIAGDRIPPMNMDRNKMKQVLVNLFENGIQHGGETPSLEIFVQHLSLADPPEIHLVVKDNGYGISRENLTRVFDPFFTTRNKGTGLGLSIVRKVIHDHGGRISVESYPGIGTTFRITLPVPAVSS